MNIDKFKTAFPADNKIKYAVLACCAVLFISALSFVLGFQGKRYILYFESVDTGKLVQESRWLKYKKYPENVLEYADELILGPKTERSRPLFSTGTYVESSFVNNGVLYINLSDDVLKKEGSACDIRTGVEVFKDNVLRTFSKIHSVEMYIDNKSIYTQSM